MLLFTNEAGTHQNLLMIASIINVCKITEGRYCQSLSEANYNSE